MKNIIKPNWPAPANVHALTTTKLTGEVDTPSEPLFLKQVHGNEIINLNNPPDSLIADGSFTTQPNTICVVKTADCLPILICDTDATVVAAVHGGWRSLAAGIIDNALSCLNIDPEKTLVWLGPAIGPDAFEVGTEVRDAFVSKNKVHKTAFKTHFDQKYLANIYELAKQQFNARGVEQIYGGEYCTFSDEKRFYSYRRSKDTGRMHSCIWIS